VEQTRRGKLELALNWESVDAHHAERRYFADVNFWRDVFPGQIGDKLEFAQPGDQFEETFGPGELVDPFDTNLVKTIKRTQFNSEPAPGLQLSPRLGRFYPASLFSQLTGVYAQDARPVRIVGLDDSSLTVDINHPLARYPLQITARLIEWLEPRSERGGVCKDLVSDLTAAGPGLQARLDEGETNFFSEDTFSRLDTRNDMEFYEMPRLVQHLDAMACSQIAEVYGRFLRSGMRVLDLMGSWDSHLPQGIDDLHVSGLGLNAEELRNNNLLAERVVHDLNQEPVLPFTGSEYDLVICTVSIEYLTQPQDVFAEVARILKPGGWFVVTFSDRWFPPKVTKLWQEMHPFERMGLVLQFFRRSKQFAALATETIQGYPRPTDDKYAQQRAYSDPVFAVWGQHQNSSYEP
jgi:hypothetical protein